MLPNSRFERRSDEMRNAIWIVISAGGNSREKEIADEYNAEACRALANERLNSNVDIVSGERLDDADCGLQSGDRIALHQGGGKRWRKKGYAAGMLIAAGFFEGSRALQDTDSDTYRTLRELTTLYFPKSQLDGLLDYKLYKAKHLLAVEDISVRPNRGNNFIRIERSHRGYVRLDAWWRANVPASHYL